MCLKRWCAAVLGVGGVSEVSRRMLISDWKQRFRRLLSGARQRHDCFFSRVTNAGTSIRPAAGGGILAVVRHLERGLIEVIHT